MAKYNCLDAGCSDAPAPPAGSNLVAIAPTGSQYQIDENILYRCVDGTYFHSDRAMINADLAVCKPGNTFDVVAVWPSCVSGEAIFKHISTYAVYSISLPILMKLRVRFVESFSCRIYVYHFHQN